MAVKLLCPNCPPGQDNRLEVFDDESEMKKLAPNIVVRCANCEGYFSIDELDKEKE